VSVTLKDGRYAIVQDKDHEFKSIESSIAQIMFRPVPSWSGGSISTIVENQGAPRSRSWQR